MGTSWYVWWKLTDFGWCYQMKRRFSHIHTLMSRLWNVKKHYFHLRTPKSINSHQTYQLVPMSNWSLPIPKICCESPISTLLPPDSWILNNVRSLVILSGPVCSLAMTIHRFHCNSVIFVFCVVSHLSLPGSKVVRTKLPNSQHCVSFVLGLHVHTYEF